MLDRKVDLTQLLGRDAHRDDLPDPHHHVPGHDLDARRRKLLGKTSAFEVRLDFVEGLGLVVPKEDGQKDAALVRRRSGARTLPEKRSGDQDGGQQNRLSFHAVRSRKIRARGSGGGSSEPAKKDVLSLLLLVAASLVEAVR